MKLCGAGILAALVLLNTPQAVSGATLSGELRQWHKNTLTFTGPNTSETASTNPFLDYRLDVTFTQGDKSYVAPGYYVARSPAVAKPISRETPDTGESLRRRAWKNEIYYQSRHKC